MTDLGSYVENDGRPAVRFERTYPHPVERVWAAISDPAELTHWFPSSVRYEPRVRGSVQFSGDPYAEASDGVVLVFDPPHRFSFSWMTDELHFTLSPVTTDSCRLTLVNVLGERSAAARNASGWYVCLHELTKLLDGHSSSGPHGDHTEHFQPIYDAHVAAGLPAGAEIPEVVESIRS